MIFILQFEVISNSVNPLLNKAQFFSGPKLKLVVQIFNKIDPKTVDNNEILLKTYENV